MVRVLITAALLSAGCARGPVPTVSEHRVALETGHIYARRAAWNSLARAEPKTLAELDWLLREARRLNRPRRSGAARAALANTRVERADLKPFCRTLLEAPGFEREALAFCRAQGVVAVEARLKAIEEAFNSGAVSLAPPNLPAADAAARREKLAVVAVRVEALSFETLHRDLARAAEAARAGDRAGFAAALDAEALTGGFQSGVRLARDGLPGWAVEALAARACLGDTLADRAVLGAYPEIEKTLPAAVRSRLKKCGDAPLARRAGERR